MPPNRAQLAKIHIAKNELNISDEIYRDILFVNFGVESSTRLSHFQAEKLLGIFTAKGWKPKRKKQAKSSPKYKEPIKRKVVALWLTLHKEGVVQNASDRALQRYVKRMTKRDNLQFCDGADCHTLIESLKRWAKREHIDVDY